MKTLKKLFLLVVLVVCAQLAFAAEYTLTSPNEKLKVVVNTDDGEGTTYQLFLMDGAAWKMLLSPSAVGMTVASPQATSTPVVWGTDATVVSTSRSESMSVTPLKYGKNAELTESYRELTITYAQGYSLVVRAYDEGAAYRFVSSFGAGTTAYVMSEQASFNFAEEVAVWFAGVAHAVDNGGAKYLDNYERWYVKYNSIEAIPTGQNTPWGDNNATLWDKTNSNDFRYATPPFTAGFNGGSGAKVVLHESDLHSYPAMYLQKDGNFGMKGWWENYPTVETTSPGYKPEDYDGVGTDHYRPLVVRRGDFIAKNVGAHKYPWRVMMVAAEDKELLTNQLTYKLASPQSESYNFDFVNDAPGRSTWDYWHNAYVGISNDGYGNMATNGVNIYKRYVDFAAENGWEYITIDTDGTNKLDTDGQNMPNLKAIIDYAHSKGVKVIKWGYVGEYFWSIYGWGDNHCPLRRYKSLGVDVFKCDFFYRTDQTAMEAIEGLAKLTAEIGLGLLLHGNPMPNGLDRTYPHILSYEAVAGNENYKWDRKLTNGRLPHARAHLETPFIRGTVGSMDYTNGSMNNVFYAGYSPNNSDPKSIGTRAHELAMLVVYDQYIATLCDKPARYNDSPDAMRILSNIPVSWDETIALDGKIGEYAAVARRKGNEWYIGGMVDAAKSFDISTLMPALSRVSDNYELYLYTDGNANDAKNMKMERITLSELKAKGSIPCVKEGGFIIQILEKKDGGAPISSGVKPFAGAGYPRNAGGNIWADYNGDGYEDVLLFGYDAFKLYRNNGDLTFTDVTQSVFDSNGREITSVYHGAASWLDYNNDGALDLLLFGQLKNGSGESKYTWLFKGAGEGNGYTLSLENTLSGQLMQGMQSEDDKGNARAVAVKDYDGDGFVDILMTGATWNGNIVPQFLLYKNEGGAAFTLKNNLVNGGNFVQVYNGGVAWGDYNNDGKPDILFSGNDKVGSNGTDVRAGIYTQNADNTFTLMELQTAAGSTLRVQGGEVAWLDYDKDGYLEALLTGEYWDGEMHYWNAYLMRYNSDTKTFTEVTNHGIGGSNSSSIAVGDLNADGYDDLITIGENTNRIFYNNQGDGTYTENNDLDLPQIKQGMVSMVDVDNDDFLDVVVTGDYVEPILFVNAMQSTDSRFASLVVADHVLTPAFAEGVTEYALSVGNEVESIDITAAAAHRFATLSGTGAKSLSVGENIFEVTVTAEDGITTTVCTLTVTRVPSTDATLKSLKVGEEAILLSEGVTEYTATAVANSVESVTLTAEAAHSEAFVADTGEKPLSVGVNTFKIMVVAEDGVTEKIYTVHLTRAKSSDAALKQLTVSEGTLSFNANQLAYTVNVANTVSEITIGAVQNQPEAAVTGDTGKHALAVGNNSFSILVTSPLGDSTRTYTVQVHRADVTASSNAALKSLSVSPHALNETFDPAVYSYTVSAACEAESISIAAEAADEGKAAVSGAGKHALSAGLNTFALTVTAEDGVALKTYTVSVMRPAATAGELFVEGKDDLTVNAETYTETGVYVQHLTNAAGCDSTLTVHVTIDRRKEYTVTFNSKGGSAVSEQKLKQGERVAKPADPTLEDYTFVGWYKDEAYVGAWNFSVNAVTANMTLYAKWTVNPTAEYTVTFNTMNGSGVPSQKLAKGSKVKKPADPTKVGYDFAGWCSDEACTLPYDFNAGVMGHLTIYASWTAKPLPKYTVTFNAQGGSAVPSQQVEQGSKATEPAAPTKDGHSFGGWYKELTLANEWNFATDMVTKNTTLYAKWTPKAPTAVAPNELSTIRLYPNPVVNGQLTIDNYQLSIINYQLLIINYQLSIEIYSVTGALVYTQQADSEKTTLNLSHLPAGVYMLKVGEQVLKFYKQN